jgi:hypothetical protein
VKPVNVGDHSRDEPLEDVGAVPEQPLAPHVCDNCFHRFVCAVPLAIKSLGTPLGLPPPHVGFCPYHMPVFENEEEAALSSAGVPVPGQG